MKKFTFFIFVTSFLFASYFLLEKQEIKAVESASVVVTVNNHHAYPDGKKDLHSYEGFREDQASQFYYLPQAYRNFSDGWNTTLMIQVGDQPADVEIRLLNSQSGETRRTGIMSMSAHQRKGFVLNQNTGQYALPPLREGGYLPDGMYSLYIESGRPFVAQALNWNDNLKTSFTSGGFPQNAGGTKFYLPSLTKGLYNWNSGIVVQNVSSSPANATITFYEANGQPLSYTASINNLAPKTSQNIYLGSMTEIPDGFTGGGVVEANKDIVVTVNNHHAYPDGKKDLHSYEGFREDQASQFYYLPQAYRNFSDGWNTTLMIQVGDQPADVEIRLLNSQSGETRRTGIMSMSAHQRKGFVLNQNTGQYALPPLREGGYLPDGMYSLYIESTRPIVSQALNWNDNLKTSFTSGGFPQNAGGTKFYLPSLTKNLYNWQSGIVVQNVSSSPANATITFYEANGQPLSYTASINNLAPKTSQNIYLGSIAEIPDGFTGGGVLILAQETQQRSVFDVNNDAKVDENDVLSLLECYQPLNLVSSACQQDNKAADVDTNNFVNALDYSLVIKNYGP